MKKLGNLFGAEFYIDTEDDALFKKASDRLHELFYEQEQHQGCTSRHKRLLYLAFAFDMSALIAIIYFIIN